ncbi:MAG: hypothetical protein DMG76_06500 [Acidobacteria bacterium]|nr:MAG: hypothetical protein DMG76_06500 [Acidobacteriota bacterium]
MVLVSCGGGGATIGVGTRQLIAVSVQPGSGQAVAPNGTVTFSATGTFDQAPTTQSSLPVQWASSDSNVASIDPNTGIATCLAVGGPITVTASAAGKGGMIHGSGTLTCQLSTPFSMQGSWIFLFHSAVSDGCVALEANLSEVGDHVFADKTSALVFQPLNCKSGTLEMQLEHLGGECDSGSVGDVTVDATLSSGAVSLTLSETGALGSVVTTASASNNGGSISNGTYSTPAACGFPEDRGSVEGYQSPIAFSGETYSGTLTFDGTAHAIVSHFTSTPHSFDLSMSGTYSGTPFVLNGSTVGLSLNLTGTIAGGQVNWFGLYDPLYNNFYIYDSDSTFVGSLENTP